MINPQRGEIWYLKLDPTVGSEIQKTRPAIVIRSNALGRLPVRLIVPITAWKDNYNQSHWRIKIDPDNKNNLAKTSAADTLQTRCAALERFKNKIGFVSAIVMEEIVNALAGIIEYQ